jgi:hypothetical protein
MRFDLTTCAVLLAGTASATWRPDPTFGTDVLAGMGMINVAIDQLTSGVGFDTTKCSLRTAVVRREWYVDVPSSRQYGISEPVAETIPGRQCRTRRGRRIPMRCFAWLPSPRSHQLDLLLVPRPDMMTLLLITSTPP